MFNKTTVRRIMKLETHECGYKSKYYQFNSDLWRVDVKEQAVLTHPDH